MVDNRNDSSQCTLTHMQCWRHRCFNESNCSLKVILLFVYNDPSWSRTVIGSHMLELIRWSIDWQVGSSVCSRCVRSVVLIFDQNHTKNTQPTRFDTNCQTFVIAGLSYVEIGKPEPLMRTPNEAICNIVYIFDHNQ